MKENGTDFILLAAGKSSRMGSDKALLEFHGKTWIEHQAMQIQASGCVNRLVIVDQPGRSFLYQTLMKHVAPMGFEIQLVENPKKDSQPMDSICLGLQAIPHGAGAFISPIDVPLKSTWIQKIWQSLETHVQAAKPSYHHQGGHPVWLGPLAIEKFKDKPQRLDEFLSEIKVHFVELYDDQIHLNFNTPEEWQSYVTRETAHPKN